MKDILAFIIVLPTTHFCLLVGTFCNHLLSALLRLLPKKLWMTAWSATSFISGALGSLVAVGFVYLVFRLVAGAESFHLWIWGAAIIALSRALFNDYKKAAQMKNKFDEIMIQFKDNEDSRDRLGTEMKSDLVGFRNWFAGEITGVIISLVIALILQTK
ncbi:MAG: hypothetical protein WC701_09545 [Kiritimatiellales bacterium]|jgi:hypothetical protein